MIAGVENIATFYENKLWLWLCVCFFVCTCQMRSTGRDLRCWASSSMRERGMVWSWKWGI
jgi:hypothetical protein